MSASRALGCAVSALALAGVLGTATALAHNGYRGHGSSGHQPVGLTFRTVDQVFVVDASVTSFSGRVTCNLDEFSYAGGFFVTDHNLALQGSAPDNFYNGVPIGWQVMVENVTGQGGSFFVTVQCAKISQ